MPSVLFGSLSRSDVLTVAVVLQPTVGIGYHQPTSRQRRGELMANTYSHLYYHLVFSTKKRTPWITSDIEQRIWAYLGGIARKNNMTALQVGGFDEHIHALISAPTTISPSRIAQVIKGDSSYWIHKEFADLKGFAWQDGYGMFSVSRSEAAKVIRYIKNQRRHHENQSFEEEYRELLLLHEIEFDERFLFD